MCRHNTPKDINAIFALDRFIIYYQRISGMTSAFLLINCDFPFAGEVTSQLAKVPEIVDIHRLHGMYDIIARVKSDTEEDLNEIVKVRIRKIDKIKSTLTMIIAEQNKIEDRKS